MTTQWNLHLAKIYLTIRANIQDGFEFVIGHPIRICQMCAIKKFMMVPLPVLQLARALSHTGVLSLPTVLSEAKATILL